jgi:nucleoside-diphosphate-sugar epimerase
MSELHVVLGATGAIGSAVAAELRRRGRSVRAVSRSGSGPDGFSADVSTEHGAIDACDGAAVVYQCAQPPYGRWVEELPALTSAALAGAARAGAGFVMADNVYMYGPVDGPIAENLSYAAENPKGRVRAEVAQLVLDAHHKGDVRTTSGRASDYYGPGGLNTTVGPSIFAAAIAGKTIRWIGDLDQPHTVSYLADIARALVTLGERDSAFGRAWHVPAAPAVTGRQFLSLVADAVGGAPRSAGMGRGLQRLVGLFDPVVRELGETWYQRDRAWVVDDSDFRQAFGADWVTSHEAGVAATVEWFRTVASA